jgi:hypothetical protein
LRKTLKIPVTAGKRWTGGQQNDLSSDGMDNVVSSAASLSPYRQAQKCHFTNPRLQSSDFDVSRNLSSLQTDGVERNVNNVNITEYFQKYDTVLVKGREEVALKELKQRYAKTVFSFV